MGQIKDIMSRNKEEIITKFREAGALSKETAMSLDRIGINPEQNPEHKIWLNYIKSKGYVIKLKDTYYLDETALADPFKTELRRYLRILLLIIPIFILLSVIMYFMK